VRFRTTIQQSGKTATGIQVPSEKTSTSTCSPEAGPRPLTRQAIPPLAREITRRWISDVPSKSE
jgi:hypothetical protein